MVLHQGQIMLRI